MLLHPHPMHDHVKWPEGRGVIELGNGQLSHYYGCMELHGMRERCDEGVLRGKMKPDSPSFWGVIGNVSTWASERYRQGSGDSLST